MIRKGFIELLRQVWNSGTCPEEWRTGVIVPIFKKGDQDRAENYRGILLLCTAYKVYADIIRKRLEDEVESEVS